MKPLLKNLMGNGAKDQEMLEAMKAVLAEFQANKHAGESFVEYADRTGHEHFAPDAVLGGKELVTA